MSSTKLVQGLNSYNDLLSSFTFGLGYPLALVVSKQVKQQFKRVTGLSIHATVTPELFNGNIRLLMHDPLTEKFGYYLTFFDFPQDLQT